MDAGKHKNGWQPVGLKDTWCMVAVKTLGGIKIPLGEYTRGKTKGRANLSVMVGNCEYHISFQDADKHGLVSNGYIYLPYRFWGKGPAVIRH